MKKFLKPTYLPAAVLCGGLIAALLRYWLFALGKDEKGLMAIGSFPDTMSWIVVAIVMALVSLGAWMLKGGNKYSYNFPASRAAAIGMILAAFSFCITSAVELSIEPDLIGSVSAWFGFLAAGALGFLTYSRVKGKHPSMIFHSIVCVYLMLYLVAHYRLWSSYPQLQYYGFELLAIVFLMMAAYQRAAFDTGCGKRSTYTFFSLGALFFCIAALPSCENYAFFIGCTAWMLATPCRLTLLRNPNKEA